MLASPAPPKNVLLQSDLIVVATSVFDDDPGFQAIAEPFHRQAFVAEFSVKALVGAVLPWLARFDQNRFEFFIHGPLQQLRAHKLRTVVASKVLGRAMQAHQTAKHVDHAVGPNAYGHVNGDALPGVFVHDGQTFKCLTVGAGVVHEVVTPNALSAVRKTRATLGASHAESFAFCRHLQTSLTPQA